MKEEEREVLIARARHRDKTALGQLIEEFYPYMYRFFYYRTRTREDAEDLSSEVFVRVVQSIEGQKGRFLPWLYRIARNILIDYYRKKGRSREISFHGLEPYVSGNEAGPGAGLSDDDIKRMSEDLTEEQKEVIILKFIEGLNNSDISQIMNKSVEAIKGLQFRALSRLRKVYKDRIR